MTNDNDPGDVVKIRKLFGYHKGVALPNGWVAHIEPGSTPKMSTIEEFAGGRPVYVEKTPDEQRGAVVLRALDALSDRRPYNVLTNNCEHFVSRALTGRRESPTVDFLGKLTIFGVTVWLAARAR